MVENCRGMTLMLVLHSILWNIIVSIVSATTGKEQVSYKIVKLDEPFRLPKSYQWRHHSGNPSPGRRLYPFSTIRADQMTSNWDLDNDTDVNKHLYETYNLTTGRCPVFHPEKFLSLLRNKKLGILGDSVALEVFEALQNIMNRYVTAYLNTTGDAVDDGGQHKLDKFVRAAVFSSYNATIYFCRDNFLAMASHLGPKADDCFRSFHNGTHFYMFGIGTWYKPKIIHEHRTKRMSYNESFEKSTILLKENIKEAREYYHTHYPQAKIIWRNQPHVGRIDEWFYLHNYTDLNKHWNGLMWSNASLCAHWTPLYNDIIAKQAAVYGDPVLDWFTLSNTYMNYFAGIKPRIPVHADTLHYYGDGVPRGGALLLQDLLYDFAQESSN